MVIAQGLIMYGDGLRALFIQKGNIKWNARNVKVVPILVIPTEEIITEFKLTEDDMNIETDDGARGMWIEYPHMQVKTLRETRDGSVILIYCSFNAAETPLMGEFDGLLEHDKHRDRIEFGLRATVATLENNLQDVLANLPEFHRKQRELVDIHANKNQEEEVN